jgi:hypothetical protein
MIFQIFNLFHVKIFCSVTAMATNYGFPIGLDQRFAGPFANLPTEANKSLISIRVSIMRWNLA